LNHLVHFQKNSSTRHPPVIASAPA